MQHYSLYNNTHTYWELFVLCTKCTGYNSNLVIAACCRGTSGVVVKRLACTYGDSPIGRLSAEGQSRENVSRRSE